MNQLLLQVYELDAKAAKSGFQIGMWRELVNASSAATAVTARSGATPGDRIRAVSEVMIISTGGGAQTSNVAELEILGPEGNRRFGRRTTYTAANVVTLNVNFLEWILLPGEYLQAAVTFSAAVAANAIEFRIIGYEMPRGNVM